MALSAREDGTSDSEGRVPGTRAAYVLSGVASVVAVALAFLPALLGETEYDPELAVLTLTLVVVIWYAAFTWVIARHASAQANAAERAADAASDSASAATEAVHEQRRVARLAERAGAPDLVAKRQELTGLLKYMISAVGSFTHNYLRGGGEGRLTARQRSAWTRR